MSASVLDFIINEPAEEYHAKAKEYLSSHMLSTFRQNPLLYYWKTEGLVVDEDRPAYLLGRAAHTLILEGRDRFNDEYAIGGPVNPKTGEPYGTRTKAWAEWAQAVGKPVLSEADAELINQMHAGVMTHPEASDLFDEGVPEAVVRTEYCGTPCQARLDWLNPTRGLVDLKTADDLTWFESDARRYAYLHQVAFYQSVAEKASGQRFPVYIVAVEKKAPYRAGVWKVSEDVLAIARAENEATIERLLRCREIGEWRAGYEVIRTFDSI